MRHAGLIQELVLILVVGCAAMPVCADEITVEQHHAGPNTIWSMDYKDGTLALATNAGLYVMRNGHLVRFGLHDGLPDDQMMNAFVVGERTLLLAEFGEWQAQRFFLVQISGCELSVEDITGAQRIVMCDDMMIDVGANGALWVGGPTRLWRYHEGSWDVFEWPGGFPRLESGCLCVGNSGEVWGCAVAYPENGRFSKVFRLDETGWTLFDNPESFSAMTTDDAGTVWGTGDNPSGLWRYDGGEWEIVSNDPVWASGHAPHFLKVGADGIIWAMSSDRLISWDSSRTTQFTQALGVSLQDLRSLQPVAEGTVLVGTSGLGLLLLQDTRFIRIFFEGIPGDHIRAVSLASNGVLWISAHSWPLLGRSDDGHFTTVWAPWQQGFYPSRCSMDINGTQWFEASVGAMRLIDDEFRLYDSSNSPLTSSNFVTVDRKGTKWFSQYATNATVVSYDDHAWQAYPSADRFGSSVVYSITVGPGDTLWFEQWEGYTMFDGKQWHHFRYGTDLTPTFLNFPGICPIVFDAHGSAFLYGYGGAYKGYPGADWEWIYDEDTMAVATDSEDTIWLGTLNGLVYGQPGNWNRISDPLTHASITTIAIDHNGDKWVGTEHGLNRIEDGGPAQQKLELAAQATPDGYLTVSGTFTNAGAVIPVLLWLACEHNGTLYYYPAWGPTPEGTKRVLGAYSIETEELLRLNASTLPPGDYTFYGGISLLGGMDLLIGARGAKIAIATYHKD
ncbi:MAG TPA: hypothetical protein VM163_00865 [bacterium]|nr:hypothetical protein [bacterium]